MKQTWLILASLVACTAAVTPTSPTTIVELIPSTSITVGSTVPVTSPPISTTATPTVETTTAVTVAPPLVTAATSTPTTPLTTGPPTVPTSPPVTIPPLTVVFSAPSEGLLTASTNLTRTSIGLPSLIHHPDLDFYARIWAGRLSTVGLLSHSDIASLLGPWLIVGENVASGTDMGQIATALAGSSDHYETMTNPAYLHTGVGVAVDPAGKLWVCQVFGGTILP